MSKEIIYGESIQEGIPTPNKPVEIKTINIIDVNGIKYESTLPKDMKVGISQREYLEYQLLKEQVESLLSKDKPKDKMIEALVLENHQLKEQNEKLRLIRVEYEHFTENTILIDNYTKTRLSKNKYLIECNDGKFVDVNELEKQLKQKDEVIDEAIEYINFLQIGTAGITEMMNTSMMGFKRFNETIWGEELLEILNKYKGDSNE